MVSRLQHYLSFLLVALMAMGWLLVPMNAQAATTCPLDIAPAKYAMRNCYNFFYRNDPSKPDALVFTWNQPNSSSLVSGSASGDGTVFQAYKIQYLLASSLKPSQEMTADICKNSTNWKFLAEVSEANIANQTIRTVADARSKIEGSAYFRLAAIDNGGTLGSTVDLPLACGSSAILKSSTPTCSVPAGSENICVQFTSTPSGATVTLENGVDLRTYAGAAKTTTPVTIIIRRGDAAIKVSMSLAGYKPLNSTFTSDKTQTVEGVLVKTSSTGESTIGSGDAVGDKAVATTTKENDALVLNQGTRDALTTWFKEDGTGPASEQFVLRDNPAGQNQAPILTVKKGKTIPEDLTFTLKYVLGVSGGFWRNNYFLFQMNKIPKGYEKKIDPTKAYLAIDLMGNIGVILERPTTSIFDEPVIDTKGEVLLAGGFDAEHREILGARVSAFQINRTHRPEVDAKIKDGYKEVITKRAYNDRTENSETSVGDFAVAGIFGAASGAAAGAPIGGVGAVPGAIVGGLAAILAAPTVNHEVTAHCVASPPIIYPNENTTYELYNNDISQQGTPHSSQRQCINVSKEGWLNTWGVKFTKLDKTTPTDPCSEAFGKGLPIIGNPLAGAICGMMHLAISGATAFAGWAVEFMVASIGLQA